MLNDDPYPLTSPDDNSNENESYATGSLRRYSSVGNNDDEADGLAREDATLNVNVNHHNNTQNRYQYRCCTVKYMACLNVILLSIIVAMMAFFFATESRIFPNKALTTDMGLPLLQWRALPGNGQEDDTTILTKIAFGSCSDQEMPQPYWDTLATIYKPDLLLLMGDNVYGDCPDPDESTLDPTTGLYTQTTCPHLQQAYQQFGLHPSVQGAVQQFPILATLDDHDYGHGDCHANNPYKEHAKQLFASFFQISDLPRDGVYRSFVFGPLSQRVQIILLDTRYNRSPFLETGIHDAPYRPPLENETVAIQNMLGEQQWTWLEEQFQLPDIDLRLVISSIQVISDGVVFEGWRHLPRERQRLYQLFQKYSKTNNTLLLSGDRHVGGFYETETGDLSEVTASSFTHTIPYGSFGSNCTNAMECDEVDPRRIGDWVRVNHFGTIDINWKQRTYTVSLRRAETSYGYEYHSHSHIKTDSGQIEQSHNYQF